MRGRCFVALLLILGDASFGQGEDAKDDGKKIQGTWLPTEADLGGQKFPEETLKTMKLVLKDDTYTVTVGKQDDKGTVKLESSKTPKTMDIVGTEGPNKGKTILAIYELKEDKLRICYRLKGEKRPTEFKTGSDGSLFLVSYERQKP